jgi:hypothetical protein
MELMAGHDTILAKTPKTIDECIRGVVLNLSDTHSGYFEQQIYAFTALSGNERHLVHPRRSRHITEVYRERVREVQVCPYVMPEFSSLTTTISDMAKH